MSQDPLERVQLFLSETKVDPLALLLDLTTLVPESLLQRAIRLAENASDRALRVCLVHALAERLPSRSERTQLKDQYPAFAGMSVDDVSVPEGKEAQRLIAELSEEERYKVFDQMFAALEPAFRLAKQSRRPPQTKSIDDDSGGVAAIDPPENVGGSDAQSDGGFEAVNDGFESMDEPLPQAVDDGFEAVDDGLESKPNVVNLGFSQKDAADKKITEERTTATPPVLLLLAEHW